jgi:ribonuclease I
VLDRIWPDLKDGDNVNFWKHEWDEYGKCSGLSQVNYLWKCLQLWEVNINESRKHG